mmetsp:Transcript_12545/g.17380  ORF Transcript_12545/g.17380 Transcript_12545/m.17380 type:complete len:130 (+) Transcript_12545:1077-1466(+)
MQTRSVIMDSGQMISGMERVFWSSQMVPNTMGNGKMTKKHGRGAFTDKTGKYIGYWKEDRQHGKGQFTSIVDNSVFEGDWVAGNRHGKGMLKFYDGSTLEQNWTHGSLETPVFGLLGSPVLPTLNTFIL